MKFVVFCISILISFFTVADDCVSTRSVSSLQSLTDVAMNSSVTLLNQEIENSVDKKLARFRVSTEMLAQQNPSKEALSDWYFNMVNMNKLAFDEIKASGIINDESEIQRLALTLVNGIVSTWIGQAFKLSMHEKSHAEAAIAAGADSISFATQKNPDQTLTIGELFQNIMTGGGAALTWYHFKNDTTPAQTAMIAGAGLNQQTKFAEQLAKESSNQGQFHQAETVPYLVNKLSVPLYYLFDHTSEFSDLKSHANALAAQGKIKQNEVDETMSKVAKYSALSALLSGRTWEGVNATMGFVQNGDATADTLKIKTPIGDVTWPEVSTYLNSDNISVKASTSLTNYDFSIEKSVVGVKITEVSATTNFKEGRTTASVTAVANDQHKYGGKIHIAYDVDGKGKWIVYGGGSYDTGTLDGKRISYQMDDAPQTHIYSGLEYRFK